MSAPCEFLSGVIEGFYGRAWSFELRAAYAGFLAESRLNTYLYAPKDDPFLRKRWREDWPAAQLQCLQALASEYHRRGINWGVGLSPFELYRDYGAPERRQLRGRLEGMEVFQAPLLAVLFDDMPGNLDDLAARQAEIVADICAWCPDTRILVCPTYYSFDPVLEQYFGPMPDNYWEQLGSQLPAAVDVFWTGNQVCSASVLSADIAAINTRVGRKVLLWDNYPVNDGAKRSNSLYLDKLANRDTDLAHCLTGHLCNPMNQGLLSIPALLGLAELYGNAEGAQAWLLANLGADTWRSLQRDSEEFLHRGIAGMGAARCSELATQYEQLPGAAAAEVTAWLRGEYTFDPACLTD